ncbi:hypothetical protein [Hyphomicrobium methylovorum]|uniref:hypothetical protein n=1 Tax=Hyphomicrobium methylovorum TaxID=84 RepID=UPI0015E67715|nr:hypothetical protein [Hyphomicrobium methylovorum]
MWVRLVFATLLAVITVEGIAAAADGRSASRVQPPGICWDPDVEFPVACDDDDD